MKHVFYSFKIRLLLVNTNSKIVKKISAEIVIIIIGAVFVLLALANIKKAKDSLLRIPLGEILTQSDHTNISYKRNGAWQVIT